MARRFLVAAALLPLALAFSGTNPVVSWSTYRSNSLDRLPFNAGHSATLIESILLNDDVCNHDAVILVEHPGLHASDLRTLSPSSRLVRSLSSSPSARQFQYVPMDASFDPASVAESVSVRCGSHLVQYRPGQEGYFSQKSKHVFSISMPILDKSGAARKKEMETHESSLSDELEYLTNAFPNHLVLYTGSSHSTPQKKRQLLPPVRPALAHAQTQANTTLSEGGILKRYQLLTPGLITVLLVTIFILLPVVMMGFSALASIQSPSRVEAPKGYNALEKKSQ